MTHINPQYGQDPIRRISDLYRMLNRRDIFADFTSKSGVALELAGPNEHAIGCWDFLYQMIITKELARRLVQYPDASISGLTPRVLASLIVCDLWFSNVVIILSDRKLSTTGLKKPDTPEEQARAEKFKVKGNEAMAAREYQQAADLYTKAIEADLTNAVYRANRSAAMLSMKEYEAAHEDAWTATELDPKYAKAWARLGAAEMKLENTKRAADAYQHAINLAGSDVTDLMKQGLTDAKTKMASGLEALGKGSDKAAKNKMRMKILDEEWDINGKNVEFHSHVHELQVEGLLLFAERLKWPYINEVRDFAEDVYDNLRSGRTIPFDLYDWIFGLTLPGKWMAFKIMTALILCTPSIAPDLGIALYYECGLSLPKQSYWRVRTVLGRVLGCLPRVLSLCGWIGPCPAVEFVPPLTKGNQPRHIRLKARRVAPIKCEPDSEDGMIYIRSRHGRDEATRIQPGEEVPAYLSEMQDPARWTIPEPPVRQLSTCSVQAVRLKKMPVDVSVAARSTDDGLGNTEVDAKAEYRATIVFQLDNNEDAVAYTLYTNPVFVTLPPCYGGPKGLHEVHMRELPRYQTGIWTVERLKDHTVDDSADEEVMVINATGNGSEVLARAWCSERGKNAVVRRSGGPCYVCAYRAASEAGLGVGVLIWVS
jgi:tetratricopeptide (TPR) repeat protein